MLAKKKAFLSIVIIVLIAPPLEFLREYAVYRINKYRLNAAAQRLKYNMTREAVTQLMGVPDVILEANPMVNARIYIDIWHWKSAENQGFFWQRLGISKYTLPLEVIAYFDGDEIIFAVIEDH